MTASPPATPTATVSPERRDILELLGAHRQFLRRTAHGLTDEQARLSPTASELSIGGLIKHVAAVEADWSTFVQGLPSPMNGDVDWSNPDPALIQAYVDGFRLLDGETLDGVLGHYERVGQATDALVGTLDLDTEYPLPPAPWFAPGATRSVRRALLHIAAETAQHAGHADIIRETIDGQKTMG